MSAKGDMYYAWLKSDIKGEWAGDVISLLIYFTLNPPAG